MKQFKTEIIGLMSAVGLLTLLAFTSSAFAEPGPRPGMEPGPFAIEVMADHLGLDDVQRQQIDNILEAARPEFEALRDRVKSEIDAVLTDEQRAKLEAGKERMRDTAERRAGKRP